MNRLTILRIVSLSAPFVATGCGDAFAPFAKDTSATRGSAEKTQELPHGKGPNGGPTFNLGKYHAELWVNYGKQKVTLHFLKAQKDKSEDLWSSEPVTAQEFILSIKKTKVSDVAGANSKTPAMSITLKPVDLKDGKATKFTGTHQNMRFFRDFEGTILGEIDGKPCLGGFRQ